MVTKNMPCTCDGIRPLLSVKDNARAKFKFRYHDLSLPCKHQTASFTINFFFIFNSYSLCEASLDMIQFEKGRK